MEIIWGKPMTFVVSQEGKTKRFTTIEQACHWLREKWPVADQKRDFALTQIEAAMNCLISVRAAGESFQEAAKSAGFKPARADVLLPATL